MRDSRDKLPAVTDRETTPSWLSGFPKNTMASIRNLGKYLVGEGSYYFDALSEKKRENKGREILTVGAAEHLVSQFGTDNPLAQRALQREMTRITQEQDNIEDITQKALEDLASKEKPKESENVIDDDWLYQFYEHAKKFSSEELKMTFAKILSGELHKPGSFAPKTLQAVSTISKEVAELFLKAASCTFHFSGIGIDPHCMIAAVEAPLGSNGLRQFGLSYTDLVILQEHGLVGSDISHYLELPSLIFSLNGWRIGNTSYKLSYQAADLDKKIKISGIRLTNVGTELFQVVDKKTNPEYADQFVKMLEKKIPKSATDGVANQTT